MDLKRYQRNAVRMKIESGEVLPGGSKFGGEPDLPAGFQWPYFPDGDYKGNPLSFLAQINCAEAAPFDTEHRLPETGMLYFFYDLDTMEWGFDPADKGCARVFYSDGVPLVPTAFPEELSDLGRLPQLAIHFSRAIELPDSEEFDQRFGEDALTHPEEYAQYMMIGLEEDEDICHKLLGYADPIQGAMLEECEMVAQGHYCGDAVKMTTSDRLIIQRDCRKWNLLLQLDTVADGDFELMFEDCGRIYFYIRDEDLEAKRFENCWLILQSC